MVAVSVDIAPISFGFRVARVGLFEHPLNSV